MQTETPFFKRRNHLLALALSTVLVTVSGCGDGGGDNTQADTTNISEAKLKADLTTGLTKGATANISAITKVLQNSAALQEVQSRASSIQPKSAAKSKAAGDGLGFGGDSNGLGVDSLGLIDDLIAQSTINQSGNVYTFDPNEGVICANDELGLDATEANKCAQLLQPMTFVVTVTEANGDEVTAAETAFKFNGTTFATTGFTPTSGFYEVDFGGLKPVLVKVNDLADAADKFDIPQTMTGRLRTDFTAPDENNATITVSIPEALALVNTVPGEQIDLSIGTTSKLFRMSANAATTELEVEVGLGTLSALFTDDDDVSSFPVELALNALTGTIAVTDSGDDMQITGLGIDTLTLKVDSVDALLVNMPQLNALLDASGANALVSLQSALDFSFNMTNVRQYFDDLSPATDSTSISIAAPAGTVLTEAGDEAIQVTGGTLTVEIEESGVAQSAVVPTGSCLDTTAITAIACPASGS